MNGPGQPLALARRVYNLRLMPPPIDPNEPGHAPGKPGIPPTWSSSAKDMVGCSLGPARLWFTIGFGIVNEVYYPRVDLPQTRDIGFIVAGPNGFWSEIKRNANYRLTPVAPGVAAVEIRHEHPRYVLQLRITPDPRRDVLLIECTLDGAADLRLYVLLAPHLGATGFGNVAVAERHRGRGLLWAEQGPFGLALAAADQDQRDAFGRISAGYVGFSDGWQDFSRNGAMTWEYEIAGPGNIALTGELPRACVLALGFGSSAEAAATLAVSSLMQPFASVLRQQVADWETWQAHCYASAGMQLRGRVDAVAPLREQGLDSSIVRPMTPSKGSATVYLLLANYACPPPVAAGQRTRRRLRERHREYRRHASQNRLTAGHCGARRDPVGLSGRVCGAVAWCGRLRRRRHAHDAAEPEVRG